MKELGRPSKRDTPWSDLETLCSSDRPSPETRGRGLGGGVGVRWCVPTKTGGVGRTRIRPFPNKFPLKSSLLPLDEPNRSKDIPSIVNIPLSV